MKDYIVISPDNEEVSSREREKGVHHAKWF